VYIIVIIVVIACYCNIVFIAYYCQNVLYYCNVFFWSNRRDLSGQRRQFQAIVDCIVLYCFKNGFALRLHCILYLYSSMVYVVIVLFILFQALFALRLYCLTHCFYLSLSVVLVVRCIVHYYYYYYYCRLTILLVFVAIL
jgi:hypothetical protein